MKRFKHLSKELNKTKLIKNRELSPIMQKFDFWDEETNRVKELENGLKKLKSHSYDSIDRLMQDIAKKHGITGKDLHNDFKNKHGKIPDEWIKENTTYDTNMDVKKELQTLSSKLAEISRKINENF